MKQFESFRLDTANECLWHDGSQIDLPPKPFAVLRYLVENPGRLITHDELLEALWPETYVQPQVLRTYMLELRKVLGDDPGQPRFIQTLPKRGYRFVATVAEAANVAVEKRANENPPANGVNPMRRATDRVDAASQPEPAQSHAADTRAVPDTGIPTARIIDRKDELANLASFVDKLTNGERQMIFLTGEAGIGKTVLVDAFCSLAESKLPGSVARGQCVEGFGPKEEYYPIMEALGHLCASSLGERVCRVLAKVAPAWLSALGRNSDSPAPASAPARMPGDLCTALEEIALQTPLVLVLEDLHWADASTLHLISALARRRAKAQLMVLATFNPQHGSAEHPLKALQQDLRMRRLCCEITLQPLERTAVNELLARELKQETLPPGLASFVHRHSEGNPLFIAALLEHLIAEGTLVKTHVDGEPIWRVRGTLDDASTGVPAGLAQMIELEMERLTEREQRLLEAGSLMHVAFPAWAVAAALDADLAETEEACDALARRLHYVQRAGCDELPDGSSSGFYSFSHGLYREVLCRRQSDSRRSRSHKRIAERLGQIFGDRESTVAREMAMHFEAGRHWHQAVTALSMAARHAVARGAGAEASELLAHALTTAENIPPQERKIVVSTLQDELSGLAHPSRNVEMIRQELAGKL
ncbi:AAA family ATPase [Acidicapsa dinghuensis]|uniref:AAA family ATPase n=1 Tax=Acidicapsa dinghuensis TaxID=2218256 RepID=A0ABW1ENI9_9BACT|nr:AAA family ATPase [Acidicapsa dinghuensis]